MVLSLYNDTYDKLCELLNPGECVLEIGCGPGNITKYLLGKRPDLNIEGTDYAEGMIVLAKKNNPGANFRVLDARNIRILDGHYDALICGFCIPYLSRNEAAVFFSDASEKLRSQGLMYISFVEGSYKNSGYHRGSTGDSLFFYYHNRNFIRKELAKNNIRIRNTYYKKYMKSDGIEEVHTIIIAMKDAV
jgi:cyclopropane fatty-acyl-phospholipid synthase-like methyltransferase